MQQSFDVKMKLGMRYTGYDTDPDAITPENFAPLPYRLFYARFDRMKHQIETMMNE